MDTFIILPDQLYFDEKVLEFYKLFSGIVMVEEPKHFMTKYAARYKAGMKMLYRRLINHKLSVKYVKYDKIGTGFLTYLAGVQSQIHMFFPVDFLMWGDEIFKARFYGLPIKFYDSPGYLITRKELTAIAKSKTWKEKTSVARRAFIHRKLGHHYAFVKEQKIESPAGNDAEWSAAISYARGIHKDVDIVRVPLSHEEGEYALAIHDVLGIRWSLHIGLLTPETILARTNIASIRQIVYDREYDRIVAEAAAKININHRRYEFTG